MIVVPPPSSSTVPSFFSFSLPKAGSTLLDAMLNDLCGEEGVAIFNPAAQLFERGVPEEAADLDLEVFGRETGYCFGTFRGFPAFLTPNLIAGRNAVLLVRDPRDMLTSQYYSHALSHVLPSTGELHQLLRDRRAELQTMSLDDSVIRDMAGVELMLDGLRIGLRRANLRLYRYEDVIYRKAEWLQDIAEFVQLRTSRMRIAEIAGQHDLLPVDERPEQHVRQVRPGDHRRKLQPGTIAQLNAEISARWERFEYPFEHVRDGLSFPASALQEMRNRFQGDAEIEIRAVEPARGEEAAHWFLPRAATADIYPNRGAEILGLWLEDGDGLATHRLRAGERFTLAYLVRISADEDLAFGFRINDRNGATIRGLNTQVIEIEPPRILAPQLAELRWQMSAPQEQGEYFLNCGCQRAADLTDSLARHVNAYAVEVTDDAL